MTHERIDAPPATFDAVSAPSSQPEPMMEPSEMDVSPRRLTARFSWFSDAAHYAGLCCRHHAFPPVKLSPQARQEVARRGAYE